MTVQQRGIIIIIVFILMVVYIKKQPNKELPDAIGDPLELIIIKNNSGFTDEIYEKLKIFLTIDLGPLPQPESLLKLVEIEKSEFKGIFRRHQNLLLVSKSQEFSVTIKKNVFANNQNVIFLKIPSIDSLIDNQKKIKDVVKVIKRLEIDRMINNFKDYLNSEIMKNIKTTHNLSLLVPKDFFLAHGDNDATWLRRETPKMSQGILLQNLNKPINKQNIEKTMMNTIDSLTKSIIQGPRENSYMAIEKEAKPLVKEVKINENKCISLQSLWKMENDFMGGVFKAYYFEGSQFSAPTLLYTYLYAPGESKRLPLIQLESIVYTIQN